MSRVKYYRNVQNLSTQQIKDDFGIYYYEPIQTAIYSIGYLFGAKDTTSYLRSSCSVPTETVLRSTNPKTRESQRCILFEFTISMTSYTIAWNDPPYNIKVWVDLVNDKVAGKTPADTASYYNAWGVTEYDQKNYGAAIAGFDMARQIAPTDTIEQNLANAKSHYAEELNCAGLALYREDNYKGAIKKYEEAIEHKNDARYHQNKADCYNSMGQYNDAILSANEASVLGADVKTQKAIAFNGQGDDLYERGKHEEAIRKYEIAISFQDIATYHSSKAKCLNLLERYDEAISSANRALELSPGLKEAKMQKAQALNAGGLEYFNDSDFIEAIEKFDMAIELNNNAKYHNQKAACYNALGNYDKALESANIAIKLEAGGAVDAKTQKAKALNGQGDNLCKAKQYGDAIDKYDEALQFQDNPTSHVGKAKCLNELKQYDDAISSANKALALTPGLKDAKVQKAKGLHAKGEEFWEQVTSAGKTFDAALHQALQLFNAAKALDNNPKYQERITAIESAINEHERLQEHNIEKHEGALSDAKVYALASAKRGFAEIKAQSPELADYLKTFYWTMINLIGAYRAASTGIIQGNKEMETDTKEKLFVAGAKKLANYGAEVAKGVPILGSAIGLLDKIIDDIYTTVKDRRFEHKVNIINKIVQSKLGMEDDISVSVALVALAVTKAKQHEILHPNSIDADGASTRAEGVSVKLASAQQWITKKIDTIKNKILPSVTELHNPDSNGAQIALKDVALTIAFLLKHHQDIIDGKKDIVFQIETIVKDGSLDTLLEASTLGIDTDGHIPVKSGNTRCCVLLSVDSIEYDNPILNLDLKTSGNLLRAAKSFYGMQGVDRLIEAGSKMSPESYEYFNTSRQKSGDRVAIFQLLSGQKSDSEASVSEAIASAIASSFMNESSYMTKLPAQSMMQLSGVITDLTEDLNI